MKPERGLELDGDLRILARWYDLRASSIAVSPDSRFALTTRSGPAAGATLLPLTGGPVRTPPFPFEALSASFGPDGVAALGGSAVPQQPAVVFWDVERDGLLSRHDTSRVLRHLDDRSFVAIRYGIGPAKIQRWTRSSAVPEKSLDLRMGREVQTDPDKSGPDASWEVDKAESPIVATPEGRVITCKSELGAGGGTNTALFEWDLDTGVARTLRTFSTDFGPGDAIHALPGNRYLIWKWWGDWWLALWDFTNETEVWRVPFAFASSAFAVDAAGARAAVVQAHGSIEIRDTHDGKTLVGARIVPHRHLGVDALAFTPDGRLVMSTSDGIVALIEIP